MLSACSLHELQIQCRSVIFAVLQRRFLMFSLNPIPRPNSYIDSWEITSVLLLGLQIEPHRLPKPHIFPPDLAAVVLLRSLHCLRLRLRYRRGHVRQCHPNLPRGRRHSRHFRLAVGRHLSPSRHAIAGRLQNQRIQTLRIGKSLSHSHPNPQSRHRPRIPGLRSSRNPRVKGVIVPILDPRDQVRVVDRQV